MEPFDLERAKAGDPIGYMAYKNMDAKFIGEHPDGHRFIVCVNQAPPHCKPNWLTYCPPASELYMKPKPIRFWVRPYCHKNDEEKKKRLWYWREEDTKDRPVWSAEWLGEAKLVEW